MLNTHVSTAERQEHRLGKLMLLGLLLLASVLLTSCDRTPSVVENLAEIEAQEYPDGQLPETRLKALEAEVERHREAVARALQEAAKTATALKQLALEYARMQFYGPSLDAFEEAIRIEPRNAQLLFWAGAISGQLAKSMGDPAERERYLSMAESFYERSVEIEPRHTESLYGLAVLLHFERGRNVEALPVAEQLLETEPKHVAGRFLLARIQAALGDVDEAIATYDRIIQEAGDDEMRERARRNRTLLTGGDE